MGKLLIRYPFINANWSLVSSAYANSEFIKDPNYKLLFTGENKIGNKYGTNSQNTALGLARRGDLL